MPIARLEVVPMKVFRIAMIGAGETGAPLLKQLIAASFVEVAGVADLNLDLPGVRLARDNGIRVTSDFMELAREDEKVDIIIDVTGSAGVREALRQHMMKTGNQHTLIMHERIALLMMSLSLGRAVDTKHGEQGYR
jgi:predicted homoserine dehydrogenase-like protein